MAFVIADRVRETTTTIGTGSVTLGGAYTSFQTFSAAIGNGNNTYYTIASASSGEWEVGIGTYASGGNLLSRDTVLASSNAGNLVNFSVGSKDVFVTQPSERSLLINSGSTGLFAGNAAFTANGIPYANSTTTLTTGSALTFDGTVFKNTGTVNNEIALDTSGTPILSLVGGSGTIPLVGYKGVGLRFGTVTGTGAAGFSELMQLTSTGLGIGTSSPGAKLNVKGGSTISALADWNTLSNSMFELANPAVRFGIGYDSSDQVLLQAFDSVNAARSLALQVYGGSVGIGTSSPGYKVDVNGAVRGYQDASAGAAPLIAANFNTGANTTKAVSLLFQGRDTVGTLKETGQIWSYPTGQDWVSAGLQFWTRSSDTLAERMRLDASGNLGIGTSSPGAKVHAFNASGTNALILENGANGGVYARWKRPNREYYLALDINNNGGNDFSLYDATAAATRLTVDSSGNLGLGVTPSAWSLGKAIEVGAGGNGLWTVGNANIYLVSNTYYASGAYRYASTNPASAYEQENGVHKWRTAPSGTANDPISFTQAMTLTSLGNLLVNTTSDDNSKVRIKNFYSFGSKNTHIFIDGGDISNTGVVVSGGYISQDVIGGIRLEQGGTYYGAGLSQTDSVSTTYSSAGFNDGNIRFFTNTGLTASTTFTPTERMRLDSSGNLGLGVTPSAWSAGRTTLQINGTTQPNIQFTGNPTNGGAIWTNSFFDGTSPKYVATGAASIFATSNGGFQWQIAPSGNANDPITFTQAMTLDASGRLLVATTSSTGASTKFVVGSGLSSSNGVAVVNTGNQNVTGLFISNWDGTATTQGPRLGFDNSGRGSFTIGCSDGADNFDICQTWGTPRVRIDSSGNLLVGTTSGSDKLTVVGNISVSGVNGNGISISSDANSNVFIPRAYSVSTSGGVAVYAQPDGRLGPNSSSQKYKTEIANLLDISWLYALNPVSFYYKNENGNKQGMLQYGFIAEEVDGVNPELVHRLGDEIESVHYHKLYAPLVKAIQELKAEVDSLKAQLKGA